LRFVYGIRIFSGKILPADRTDYFYPCESFAGQIPRKSHVLPIHENRCDPSKWLAYYAVILLIPAAAPGICRIVLKAMHYPGHIFPGLYQYR